MWPGQRSSATIRLRNQGGLERGWLLLLLAVQWWGKAGMETWSSAPKHGMCHQSAVCCPSLQAPLALVSSAPEARVMPALEAADLVPRFDAIVTADDVYRGKPDPEGYLYAAQVRWPACCCRVRLLAGSVAGCVPRWHASAVPRVRAVLLAWLTHPCPLLLPRAPARRRSSGRRCAAW